MCRIEMDILEFVIIWKFLIYGCIFHEMWKVFKRTFCIFECFLFLEIIIMVCNGFGRWSRAPTFHLCLVKYYYYLSFTLNHFLCVIDNWKFLDSHLVYDMV